MSRKFIIAILALVLGLSQVACNLSADINMAQCADNSLVGVLTGLTQTTPCKGAK